MQRVVLGNLMVVFLTRLVKVCRVGIVTLLQIVDLLNETKFAKGCCLKNGISDSRYHWNKKLLTSFFQLINSSSLDLCVR